MVFLQQRVCLRGSSTLHQNSDQIFGVSNLFYGSAIYDLWRMTEHYTMLFSYVYLFFFAD